MEGGGIGGIRGLRGVCVCALVGSGWVEGRGGRWRVGGWREGRVGGGGVGGWRVRG